MADRDFGKKMDEAGPDEWIYRIAADYFLGEIDECTGFAAEDSVYVSEETGGGWG